MVSIQVIWFNIMMVSIQMMMICFNTMTVSIQMICFNTMMVSIQVIWFNKMMVSIQVIWFNTMMVSMVSKIQSNFQGLMELKNFPVDLHGLHPSPASCAQSGSALLGGCAHGIVIQDGVMTGGGDMAMDSELGFNNNNEGTWN